MNKHADWLHDYALTCSISSAGYRCLLLAADEIERLERERGETLERCYKMVIGVWGDPSLSTGHAETVEDLMLEVLGHYERTWTAEARAERDD